MTNSLAATQETTFGSDGKATIVIGPAIRGEVWNIDHLAVSTDNATATQAYIFRGFVSDTSIIEATANGNADVTNTGIRITAPELLAVQWRNGTAGKRAILHLEGKREY